MGQLQLFLIVTGVFIVGIAIAIGISTFPRANTSESPSLAQVGSVYVTTTAPSVYDDVVGLWTTTATLQMGNIIFVFGREQLQPNHAYRVRKVVISYRFDQDVMYWAQ